MNKVSQHTFVWGGEGGGVVTSTVWLWSARRHCNQLVGGSGALWPKLDKAQLGVFKLIKEMQSSVTDWLSKLPRPKVPMEKHHCISHSILTIDVWNCLSSTDSHEISGLTASLLVFLSPTSCSFFPFQPFTPHAHVFPTCHFAALTVLR